MIPAVFGSPDKVQHRVALPGQKAPRKRYSRRRPRTSSTFVLKKYRPSLLLRGWRVYRGREDDS